MQQCPECKGKKEIYSRRFVNRTEGCTYEEGYQICSTCGGSGSVTEAHLTRIRQGEQMRADRLSRDMSLREEAKQLGIKPSELNDLERGRV